MFVVVASVEMHPHLCRDRYLAEHVNWYVREMRVNAYVQFLESYRSVTVSSMAKTFGVSVPFLDSELSRFISAGRINAKIDKVCQVRCFGLFAGVYVSSLHFVSSPQINDVIETTRPDAKNAQYHQLIQHGDALLNRIQQLARVVSV